MDSIIIFDLTFRLFQSGDWHYAIPVKENLNDMDRIFAFNQPAVQIILGNTKDCSSEDVFEFFQKLHLELKDDN